MKKGNVIWYWTNYLDLCSGEIYDWMTPYHTGRESIAKIRSFNGFSIHLPGHRIFDTEDECKVALRDYKLNDILDV